MVRAGTVKSIEFRAASQAEAEAGAVRWAAHQGAIEVVGYTPMFVRTRPGSRSGGHWSVVLRYRDVPAQPDGAINRAEGSSEVSNYQVVWNERQTGERRVRRFSQRDEARGFIKGLRAGPDAEKIGLLVLDADGGYEKVRIASIFPEMAPASPAIW